MSDITNDVPAWPAPQTREARPWTRWWWMGSALTEAEITRSLEGFRSVGVGGVEVSPIYGPKGEEARFVPFLSPRWAELFAHTLREAARLDMGVDLIAGTGWPFGGPWVGGEDAARVAWVEAFAPGQDVRAANPKRADVAKTLAVTEGEGGRRYALFLAPTGQQVKRAAPGGEGNVLDHFDADAVRRYLAPFDAMLRGLPEGLRPRCLFNDSWEVFGANATPDILGQFARRRGYDLRAHLHHLKGDGDPDTVRRVRADFRLTVEDLTREAFLAGFADAARRNGAKARNQSHGSPGNLLDLYGMVDIPETEVFGPPRLKRGGMAALTDVPPDFGEQEEALACRMASSAAHVAGRPLCSSESFTWAGEHGHVPLEHMKAEADTLFALGINHIFFHGTPYSPSDAAWPGWLFYATTLCAPANPWWRDLGALNAYIARCQSLLQAGTPDGDVLLYFPFHDLLAADEGAQDYLHFLNVHRTGTWLGKNLPAFTRAARALQERGWSADLVSDRQLAADVTVSAEGGTLEARRGGSRWRALLVAGCHLAPPETLERFVELAHRGATVLVEGDLPADVPGLAQLAERRARLRVARTALGTATAERDGIRRYAVGRGQVLVGPDAAALLTSARIPRETIVDGGIEFIRRRGPGAGERVYLLTNPGTEDRAGWFSLVRSGEAATLLDAWTGRIGTAARRDGPNGPEVRLEVKAGASLFVRTGPDRDDTPPWQYLAPAGGAAAVDLSAGDWRVEFFEGGPTLPAARTVAALSDWTTWDAPDADALRAFSGTARYARTFDAPTGAADAWTLELGAVCHSARVRLNGADLGAVVARPWEVTFPASRLKPTGNRLEVEVTNLMANRLADLERRRGAEWRPFLMVNIHYKPFDAATWKPTPSGLIGPVRLVPMRASVGA